MPSHSASAASSGHALSAAFIRTWLAVLLVIACYIRVHGVGDYILNGDESLHYAIARGRTLGEVLAFSRYEAHPPLYYICLHYWLELGVNPAWARGFSLLFGLLLIPLYYRIGTYLNGPMTGLVATAMVTFSPGCVVQSYLVRHYALFLFLISCSFYLYLRWRGNRSHLILSAYGVSCLLACMTHFSGLLFMALPAGFEAVHLLRRRFWKPLSYWLCVNAMAAAATFAIYHLWQPRLTALALFFEDTPHYSPFAYPFVYSYNIAVYLFSGFALAALPVSAIGILYFPHTAPGKRDLHFVAMLAAMALGFGLMLAMSGIYPLFGTRHSLWLFPFLIPVSAWIIADGLEALAGKLGNPHLIPTLGAAFILSASLLLYDAQGRFTLFYEYQVKQKDWQDISHALDAMDSRSIIILEKDDAIHLQNVYPFLGRDGFAPPHSMATLIPYGRTHLVINPYYIRFYTPDIFLKTLEEAQRRHMLVGVDTLVFLRFHGSRSPVVHLMLCNIPGKKSLLFPLSLNNGASLTRTQILDAEATLASIPKSVFFRDIAPENAVAHGCLAAQ